MIIVNNDTISNKLQEKKGGLSTIAEWGRLFLLIKEHILPKLNCP